MSSLVLDKLIGTGAYGSVYHGRWEGRPVAIKKFHISRQEVVNTADTASLQREIQLLSGLRDKHIIQFYGTTFDENDMLVLAMEYAAGGSLHGAINGGEWVRDWPTKIRIAQEMVRGISYIHHKQIIHRDLKSLNVLLTSRMEVKLADFGLATVKTHSASRVSSNSTHGHLANANSGLALKGTLRWMAPELFDKQPKYSTKSDMYGLGMVMWEMAANCTMPFRNLLDNAAVVVLVTRGEREDLPQDTPDEYRQTVERCWDMDPAKRPTASELVVLTDEERRLQAVVNDNGLPLLALSDIPGFDPLADTAAASTQEGGDQQSQPSLYGQYDQLIQQAEGNDKEAQWTLANMYAASDAALAFQWYRRAAEQGHAEAQYTTAQCYEHGRGVPQSYSDAAVWYRHAAHQAHREARYHFAYMLHHGLGVQQDLDEASVWYRRAAEQGHTESRHMFRRLAEKGHGLPPDLKRTVQFVRKLF
ncbi:hypothetical protein BGZ73_007895 [Actinomortierella ambigua]|nr:hypothetical protein BGZ73_007895 [Actinomortierella ambigua]